MLLTGASGEGAWFGARDVAKKLDEEIIAEGRSSSHAAAEPSNGRPHVEPEDDRGRRGGFEGSQRADEGSGRGAYDDRDRERDRDRDRDRNKGRRRERSESLDRHRDERRRRRRHSRSRSPDRDRCKAPHFPVSHALVGPLSVWRCAVLTHHAPAIWCARSARFFAHVVLPCTICVALTDLMAYA